MSRYGKVLALLSLAGLALAGCAPASTEEDVTKLAARVETLEKQIQTLQAGGGAAKLEQEAQASFAAVNQLVAQGKVDEAKQRLASDITKYASTRVGQTMQALSRELAVVGKDCPSDWGIEKWYQGKDAIRLDGQKTTVVVFWESWCPHCRKEVPKLQEMYEKYSGEGLQLIGVTRVNKSATEESVQDIITQNNVKYPMAKENGSLAEYFAVSGIPAAAVVKDGKVVWRGHPARLTDDMLKNWLAS
jgi:thiol-disulfide isomerase/thioredoxin